MKKPFRRVSGASRPLTASQKQDHQRIHEELPKDPDLRTKTQRIRDDLKQAQYKYADVVTALKAARDVRGLSLQDICDKTGITRASLSLLENGKGNPTMSTLRRIADAIGVEILVTVR
jgi:ribosome-binding protein aMBF1 (putative translation factor)